MIFSCLMPGKKRISGLRGLRGPQEVLKISAPVENITLAVGHYAELLVEYTGDRLSWKVKDPEMVSVDKIILDSDAILKKEAKRAALQKSWDDEVNRYIRKDKNGYND